MTKLYQEESLVEMLNQNKEKFSPELYSYLESMLHLDFNLLKDDHKELKKELLEMRKLCEPLVYYHLYHRTFNAAKNIATGLGFDKVEGVSRGNDDCINFYRESLHVNPATLIQFTHDPLQYSLDAGRWLDEYLYDFTVYLSSPLYDRDVNLYDLEQMVQYEEKMAVIEKKISELGEAQKPKESGGVIYLLDYPSQPEPSRTYARACTGFDDDAWMRETSSYNPYGDHRDVQRNVKQTTPKEEVQRQPEETRSIEELLKEYDHLDYQYRKMKKDYRSNSYVRNLDDVIYGLLEEYGLSECEFHPSQQDSNYWLLYCGPIRIVVYKGYSKLFFFGQKKVGFSRIGITKRPGEWNEYVDQQLKEYKKIRRR